MISPRPQTARCQKQQAANYASDQPAPSAGALPLNGPGLRPFKRASANDRGNGAGVLQRQPLIGHTIDEPCPAKVCPTPIHQVHQSRRKEGIRQITPYPTSITRHRTSMTFYSLLVSMSDPPLAVLHMGSDRSRCTPSPPPPARAEDCPVAPALTPSNPRTNGGLCSCRFSVRAARTVSDRSTSRSVDWPGLIRPRTHGPRTACTCWK